MISQEIRVPLPTKRHDELVASIRTISTPLSRAFAYGRIVWYVFHLNGSKAVEPPGSIRYTRLTDTPWPRRADYIASCSLAFYFIQTHTPEGIVYTNKDLDFRAVRNSIHLTIGLLLIWR